jgi:hypothetical protein
MVAADNGCSEVKHQALAAAAMPAWDYEAAKNMTADQVRARFPRGHAFCPDCNWGCIVYADSMQYHMGDY